MATVALDLLGGDGSPDVVADAVALLVGGGRVGSTREGSNLVLVGPAERSADLLSDRGVPAGAVRLVDAGRGASMSGNPLALLRAADDVTVSIGIGLVRSGLADAFVSSGHTGATVAAAVLGLGRLPGVLRPALAVVLPSLAGPVVLVDAGAAPDATADVLRQFSLVGWAYACSLGIVDPAVGLLTIGSEAGKGDRLRLSAHELLEASLPAAGIRYVGAVEGHDLAVGDRAQVLVTDGFTGNVLLKGIEGAALWAAVRMGAAYGDPDPARGVLRDVGTGDFAGGMVLGVDGVVVVGHGAAGAEEIAACVRLADRAARTGLVRSTTTALARLTVPRAAP